MLYPFRQTPHFDPGQFLIEKVQIRRWVNGRLPPKTIGLGRADFVVANPAQLQQAGAEVQLIKQALTHWNTALSADTISVAADLFNLFRRDLLNLLHVACHQSFENDDGRFKVGTAPIGPTDFIKFRLSAMPFIFMNACRSDRQVPRYNKIGGWANAFLDIGAGAFIGTLWEVRDTTAQLFANTLYTELLQNRSTFGLALQRARAVVKQQAPGDPTWLAYTFYGDTEARLGVNLESELSEEKDVTR
jgi:CHAT domain-containing protein